MRRAGLPGVCLLPVGSDGPAASPQLDHDDLTMSASGDGSHPPPWLPPLIDTGRLPAAALDPNTGSRICAGLARTHGAYTLHARTKKTFAAFVAVATIAGSLAATPASAQRGVAAGVAAPGRYYEPAPYGAGRGPYDDFGSCEWVTQRFWDGHGWRVRRVRVCG